MRRRLRILIVLASTFAMVLMLNVGTALADNTGAPTVWDCSEFDPDTEEGGYSLDVGAPIFACVDEPGVISDTGSDGIAVSERTLAPILTLPAGVVPGLFNGIDRNPFCLLHDSDRLVP